VLNTLLIAEALDDRSFMTIPYERVVNNRDAILAEGSQFLFGQDGKIIDVSASDPADEGFVFSTRKQKNKLQAKLDAEDVKTVRSEVRRLLADSLAVFTESQYLQAQELLESETEKYIAIGRQAISLQDLHLPKSESVDSEVTYVPVPSEVGEVMWANELVSNGEFVEFLNAMHQEGLPNVINGTQLFVNENMIPGRGGRIWYNAIRGSYEVAETYLHYPAYWVTWLGAAAFARYKGARLPERSELQELVDREPEIDFDIYNCGHKKDDVQPSSISRPNANGIHDIVGNLAVWCSDGFSELPSAGSNRYMFGTAWNREASHQELTKLKARPLPGCSRSVGIRLIRDQDRKLTAPQLVERFEDWFSLLGKLTDKRKTDRYIIDYLTF
jgi:hypothetical protein